MADITNNRRPPSQNLSSVYAREYAPLFMRDSSVRMVAIVQVGQSRVNQGRYAATLGIVWDRNGSSANMADIGPCLYSIRNSSFTAGDMSLIEIPGHPDSEGTFDEIDAMAQHLIANDLFLPNFMFMPTTGTLTVPSLIRGYVPSMLDAHYEAVERQNLDVPSLSRAATLATRMGRAARAAETSRDEVLANASEIQELLRDLEKNPEVIERMSGGAITADRVRATGAVLELLKFDEEVRLAAEEGLETGTYRRLHDWIGDKFSSGASNEENAKAATGILARVSRLKSQGKSPLEIADILLDPTSSDTETEAGSLPEHMTMKVAPSPVPAGASDETKRQLLAMFRKYPKEKIAELVEKLGYDRIEAKYGPDITSLIREKLA